MRFMKPSSWCAGCVVAIVAAVQLMPLDAQVRRGRTSVVKGEEKTVVANRRGVAVKGDEGYGAVGRRGGVVASNEERTVVSNRRGTVVAGEEGFAASSRHGGAVVVGERYEDHDGWRTAAAVGAGVATGIAIGAMLSKPPATSVTVVTGGSTYWYDNGAYYTRVYQGGDVVYQVVPAPAGAVIVTLPAGCVTTRVGNVAYRQCGSTYYQQVSGGYRVVVF